LILQAVLRIKRGAPFQVLIVGRTGQRVAVQLPLGETADHRAGVAVEHSTGAVAVQALADQNAGRCLRASLPGALQSVDEGSRARTEPVDKCQSVTVSEVARVQQAQYYIANRTIARIFLAEGLHIMETLRVVQAQSGKMAVLAKRL